jgi:hypothetical protein
LKKLHQSAATYIRGISQAPDEEAIESHITKLKLGAVKVRIIHS